MPSTTSTDICNRALAKLDFGSIQSLTDGTKRAGLCNEYYDSALDELLAEHPWSFATTRVELSQTTALDGWTYAHTLPSDFIRMVAIGTGDDFSDAGFFDYQREGRLLLSESTTVWLRYVKRYTDVQYMPALFQMALVERLAAFLAVPLGRAASTAQTYMQASETTLAKAMSQDGFEETKQDLPDSSWVAVRY